MKKVKLKKKKKYNYLILLLLFLTTFIMTIKHLVFKKIDINNKELLTYLVNSNYKNNNGYDFIVKNVIKLCMKIDISKPETFLTINKIKKNKKEIKEVYKREDEYNPSDYEKITSYIQVKNDIKEPILYIYNTHQLETYSSINISNNMVPNVMMAGSLLTEKLNKNDIKTVFEDTNLSDFISKMGLPSNELYGGSRVFITNAKEKYPSLKYYIDLHRDSVNKDISTINIDNKNYARVLFVLGTTNSNYEENNKMMSKLNSIINEKYPGVSRGIYEVDIPDWPEIYNQDLDKNVILIELGAKDNDINEVLNTIDVLTYALTKYIKEDK